MNPTGMSCKQCNGSIDASEGIISCDGFCLGSYHPACVDLKIEAVVIWNQHPGIWWMCDECGKLIQNLRGEESFWSHYVHRVPVTNTEMKCDRKAPTDVNEEIAELKKQVSSIQETLEGMNSAREISMDTSPIAQSSPNQPLRIKHGSKPVACRISSSTTLNDASRKYSLFLTKIKNTATENDILEMVIDSLGIGDSSDAVSVKKLVPHWRDISTMPFISFKIGLDIRYKHVADLPSTWPKGLCFREFVETAALWDPSTRIVHMT